MTILRYGKTAVPWTVSWSDEKLFVGYDPIIKHRAICQEEKPGSGTPQFGKPHSNRQRQACAQGLCDLCGKTLRLHTKVSLSHASVRENGADGHAVMQVEPMLHTRCARESLRWCPSLKRDIDAGTLMIRQVTKFRVQFALVAPIFIKEYVPDYEVRTNDRIIGHGKVELLKWIGRDLNWLMKGDQ